MKNLGDPNGDQICEDDHITHTRIQHQSFSANGPMQFRWILWPPFFQQDLAHHPIFWTEEEGIGECDALQNVMKNDITRSFGVWTPRACL